MNSSGSLTSPYGAQIEQLKNQLRLLEQGTLPEYQRGQQRLEKLYNDELLYNSLCKKVEIDRMELDHANDLRNAVTELEERKIEVKEMLMAELDEKKRQIEHEYQQTDLSGDVTELKPMTTRKLRNRRANDVFPAQEKRQQKISPPYTLNGGLLLLRESDVNEDLVALNLPLNRASYPASTASSALPVSSHYPSAFLKSGAANGYESAIDGIVAVSSSPSYARKLSPKYVPEIQVDSMSRRGYQSPTYSASSRGSRDVSVYVENSRLWYESRWFGRGVAVEVESDELGCVPGVIQSITAREIRVKRSRGDAFVRVTLGCLQSGKVVLKKRSPATASQSSQGRT